MAIEDYDRAKALKAEIDVIRRQIDIKLEPYLQSLDPASAAHQQHHPYHDQGGMMEAPLSSSGESTG